MRTLPRSRRLLAAVVLPGILLLPACGGGDSSTDREQAEGRDAPSDTDGPTDDDVAQEEEEPEVPAREYDHFEVVEESSGTGGYWAVNENLVGGWASGENGDVAATYTLDGQLVGTADDDVPTDPCARVITGGDDPAVLMIEEQVRPAEGVQPAGFDFMVTKATADFATSESTSMGFSEERLSDGLNGYGFTCPFHVTSDGAYLLMARGLTWLLVDVETMEARELDDVPVGYAVVGNHLVRSAADDDLTVIDPSDLSTVRSESETTPEGERLHSLVEEFLGAGLLNDSNSYRLLPGDASTVAFWRGEDEGEVLVAYDVATGEEVRTTEPLESKAFHGLGLFVDWSGENLLTLDPEGALTVLDQDFEVVATRDAAAARISQVCGAWGDQVAAIASDQLVLLDRETLEQIDYSDEFSSCGNVPTQRFAWGESIVSFFDQEIGPETDPELTS